MVSQRERWERLGAERAEDKVKRVMEKVPKSIKGEGCVFAFIFKYNSKD